MLWTWKRHIADVTLPGERLLARGPEGENSVYLEEDDLAPGVQWRSEGLILPPPEVVSLRAAVDRLIDSGCPDEDAALVAARDALQRCRRRQGLASGE